VPQTLTDENQPAATGNHPPQDAPATHQVSSAPSSGDAVVENASAGFTDADADADTTALDARQHVFNFTVGPKPQRFVWDMDTDNRFRSVSAEFAETVGPQAAAVEGQTWQDLSDRHHIENGDEITALLKKGDTWSGKTVQWPVEGTDLRVPVDLAGLPSYGRNRQFDGFNGFGIIRTADAVVDPDAPGLSLAEEMENTDSTQQADLQVEPSQAAEPSLEAKIIDLDALRDNKSERSLSTDEQETFEEIGEKLSDETDNASDGDRDPAQRDDSTHEEAGEFIPSALVGPARKKPTNKDDAGSDVNIPEHNVDTSILARLPIPVLVYRANDLLFGNSQFFNLTGHDNLAALARAGGIEALFGNLVDEDSDSQPRIFHADGAQLDVQANLQRVPWDDDRAMLLTLRNHRDSDEDNRPDDNKHGLEKADSTGTEDDNQTASDGRSTEAQPSGPVVSIVPFQPAARPPVDDTSPAFGGLEAEDLRNILDTATDGVVILSDEGIIQALNKSAEALFDVGSSAVLEQSFTRLLAPESQRSAMDYLSGMSGTGVASLMNDGREVIGKTARDGLIPLFMTIGKLQKTDACCAVMRDITQWKKAEEELLTAKTIAENASAQKTEFLAKVSHEIRTPLNAIIGFSDMMIEERFGKIDSDRYRGYLRDIPRSGNHVLELVNDLLDISKIEAGKMELEFDACDLNTTVSESVALTQPDANKERIIIRTSLSAVVPKVVADPRSLRQIILNLVSNSIKFTKPGGQVIVSTVYEESGEVVLRVRDTGIGMSEVDLAKALKPFQQIDAQTDRQGTGLGLPLTKAMVEANRARFEIESEPEEGTLVEIYFPSQRVLADR